MTRHAIRTPLHASMLTWLITAASASSAQAALIDYFKPMPVVGSLSTTAWGAAAVGARDQSNGLEDKTMAQYSYWDGQILKGPDGKYHMFASRWAQSRGMSGWSGSIAVHAVSDSLYGPYADKGAAYTDSNGKGHNVTAALLPDGKYAIIASDTRPGAIFLGSTIDGPFAYQGDITVNANGFDASGTTKNLSLTILPDKSFLMATRFGAIMTSPTSLLGPWTVRGPRVFTTPTGYPAGSREDPVIWCSGGQFHLVYNYYDLRKARHMVSADGITGWKDMGIAYDPTTNFVRYADGTINHWYKMERPGVYMENGHVVAFTFAVIDVDKAADLGNDAHGTKVIVVPFDGVGFDAATGVAGNACSTYGMNSGVPGTTTGTGGTSGVGGSSGTAAGGATSAGGTTARGGTTSTGGAKATGGTTSSTSIAAGGAAASSGGTKATGTGGAAASIGGALSSGGSPTSTAANVGGAVAAAGGAVAGVGGAVSVGGALASTSGVGGGVIAGTTVIASGGSTTVANAVGGASSTSQTTDGAGDDAEGCSCHVAGAKSQRPLSNVLLAALGFIGLVVRRRHRR